MKYRTRKQKLQARKENNRGRARFSEAAQPTADRLMLEAKLSGGKTGREWDVTIIGASDDPASVITQNGKTYIVSQNGRLYDTARIEAEALSFDGIKVYDNHLTEEEFNRKQGMRSPKNEWIGTIVKPVWDKAAQKLRGTLKIIDDALAAKLKNAWDAGVLGSIGLSIDTFPNVNGQLTIDGRNYPVIEGFKKILSVDLVGNPAAGGGFDRLVASVQEPARTIGDIDMDKEELQALLSDFKSEILAEIKPEPVAEAEVDDLTDEEVTQALDDKQVSEAQKALVQARRQTEAVKREADLARTQLRLERKLEKAKLPEKFEEAVRRQFEGRIVDDTAIDDAIKAQRAAFASLDPSGRISNAGMSRVEVGVDEEERFQLAFMEAIMRSGDFKTLGDSEDETVKDRLAESSAYQSWVKNGKPALPRYPRLSNLLWEYFGGNPLLDPRASEAASTSSLATVVKNTVNIMAANAYSQKELWFERIVRTEEVDTIDQTTLARVYGVSSLSTVPEGDAYTELSLSDEEETASFVKRGNYIGVTLETLMSDKINEIRRIPEKLANAWYNTQSDLVSAVFTANTAAGPVLSDTGALFNNTAVTTPGGHANLLTTALSHTAYAAARLAMRKQTDQPLGAGRRLLINPRYLLVPADLEITALDIRNSALVPEANGAGTTGNQTVNNFQGTFEVIVVPPWTDTNNWALVADPAQFPSIWLIYPRGMRAPQIFSADSETGGTMFTNDEMRFKARLMTYRFSATYDTAPVSDFRGLHKSNVA